MNEKIVELTDVVENELATVVKQKFIEKKEDGKTWFCVDFVFDNILSEKGEKLGISKMWDLEDDQYFKYFMQSLGILGWNGKDIFNLDPTQTPHDSLVGHQVSLVTTRSLKNNKIFVKFINDPYYIPQNNTISAEKKKILAAKLKGKVAIYHAENKIKSPAQAQTTSAKNSGEEEHQIAF